MRERLLPLSVIAVFITMVLFVVAVVIVPRIDPSKRPLASGVFRLKFPNDIIPQQEEEVQRLLFVVVLAVIVIGLPLLVLSDTAIPTADVDVPDNEVTSIISKASNSSASATTTITMTGMPDE